MKKTSKIIMVLVVLIAGSMIAAGALLSYYGKVETTVNVLQSVRLDGMFYETGYGDITLSDDVGDLVGCEWGPCHNLHLHSGASDPVSVEVSSVVSPGDGGLTTMIAAEVQGAGATIPDYEPPTTCDITVDDDGGADHVTIQAAVTAASDNQVICVKAGTYGPFEVSSKTGLTIAAKEPNVIVSGTQQVTTTNYGDRHVTIFVDDSTNIVLKGFTIQGTGYSGSVGGGKDYAIVYEGSTGSVEHCTITPNTAGDMFSTAIAAWDGSNVNIKYNEISDVGRLGVFLYNGVTALIDNNIIEGQVYSGEGEVNYGIEVEDSDSVSTATITNNDIYNFDNTFSTGPTWESGAIYINGWLEHQAASDNTVIVEYNNIYDNYAGIIVIASANSYAHYNNIVNSRTYDVNSLPAYDSSTITFNAANNWFGCDGMQISANVYATWHTWIDGSIITLQPNDYRYFMIQYCALDNAVGDYTSTVKFLPT